MELHNLKPAPGSTKKRKRIARGQGSGRGGTSTRGHKGAKSRSGYSRKRGFEGGQMPIHMRLPKRGFNSRNRTTYVPMNLTRLMEISEKYGVTEITLDWLVEKHIIRKNDLVKILANGELSKPLKVTAHKCSEKAQKAFDAIGGTINLV